MSEKIYDCNSILLDLPTIINQKNIKSGIHLAILVKPYLQYIIEGKKTVESRFSIKRIAPYKQIFKNDIILLKKSGGNIVGFCKVREVWFYQLNQLILNKIKNRFEWELCIQDPQFWESKKKAKYVTIIKLGIFNHVFIPIRFQKRDRRGWVVLKQKINKKQKEMF